MSQGLAHGLIARKKKEESRLEERDTLRFPADLHRFEECALSGLELEEVGGPVSKLQGSEK